MEIDIVNIYELFQELQPLECKNCTVNMEKIHINDKKDRIIIDITKKKSFQDCCKEFYNTHKEIFYNPNIKFFSKEDYTFCIYKNKIYYAKKHKNDHYVSLIGQVAAWARATKTNINKMIGYD